MLLTSEGDLGDFSPLMVDARLQALILLQVEDEDGGGRRRRFAALRGH